MTILALTFLAMQANGMVLANADFANGTTNWRTTGSATVDHGVLRLGAHAALTQRFAARPNHIFYLGAKIEGPGQVELAMYDAGGRRLANLTATPDKQSTAGIYARMHPLAAVAVATYRTAGPAIVRDARFTDEDQNRTWGTPKQNLDEMLAPIRPGGVIRAETVLLMREGDTVRGSLLYPPARLTAVTDATAQTSIDPHRFQVTGRQLSAPLDAAIPSVSPDEFPKTDLPWADMQGRHVLVTYEAAADRWAFPQAPNQSRRLPHLSALLGNRKPVSIVGIGDSITLGINVSGYRMQPPYLPNWLDLTARELQRRAPGASVHAYNVAIGGMTSQWGKDNAAAFVANLRPNLVFIGFGMNDFWWMPPADFRANLQSIIATVRRSYPNCEFVLVTSMRFDPAYTHEEAYLGNFAGYAREARALVGPGIAILDMESITRRLYARKSARDFISDPMHPNDFLTRIYAISAADILYPPSP